MAKPAMEASRRRSEGADRPKPFETGRGHHHGLSDACYYGKTGLEARRSVGRVLRRARRSVTRSRARPARQRNALAGAAGDRTLRDNPHHRPDGRNFSMRSTIHPLGIDRGTPLLETHRTAAGLRRRLMDHRPSRAFDGRYSAGSRRRERRPTAARVPGINETLRYDPAPRAAKEPVSLFWNADRHYGSGRPSMASSRERAASPAPARDRPAPADASAPPWSVAVVLRRAWARAGLLVEARGASGSFG